MDRFAVSDFLVVGFATIRLAEIVHALSVFVAENHVFVGVHLFFPLYASRCFSGLFGRWRRRSVPSMIKSVGTPGVTRSSQMPKHRVRASVSNARNFGLESAVTDESIRWFGLGSSRTVVHAPFGADTFSDRSE